MTTHQDGKKGQKRATWGPPLPGFAPAPPEASDPSGDEWYTPAEILRWVGPIAFDPCWAPGSHVQPAACLDVSQGHCGLTDPWQPLGPGVVFCNPPFSAVRRWLARCREQSERLGGRVVVALVPAVPGDGPWVGEVWGKARLVGFIRHRVHFTGQDGSTASKGRGHALVLFCRDPFLADDFAAQVQARAAQHDQCPVWVREVA